MEYLIHYSELHVCSIKSDTDTAIVYFARMIRDMKKETRYIDTPGQALYYLENYCDNIKVLIVN